MNETRPGTIYVTPWFHTESNNNICQQIFVACRTRKWNVARQQLQQIDSNNLSEDDREHLAQALAFAVDNRQLELADLLLSKGAKLIHTNYSFSYAGYRESALHMAVSVGDAEMVRIILGYAKQTNQHDELLAFRSIHQHSPLVRALVGRQTDVVQVFIEEEFVLDPECVQIYLACQEGKWGAAQTHLTEIQDKVLSEDGTDILTIALAFAAAEGKVRIARLLLGKGAKLDHHLYQSNDDVGDVTALNIAAYRGDVAMTRLLLKQAKQTNQLKSVLSHTCYHRCTPLLQALTEEHLAVVDVFIEEDAILDSDIIIEDAPDTSSVFSGVTFLENTTLLHLALIEGADNLARHLITHFPECVYEITGGDDEGDSNSSCDEEKSIASLNDENIPEMLGSPLHVACRLGNLELVKLMVQRCPQSIITRDKFGRTPIFYAAADGNFELYKLLLMRMKFRNPCDARGEKPLHLAVRNNRVDFIAEVIALMNDAELSDLSELDSIARALLDAENRDGCSLLQTAVMLDRIEIVELLARCEYVDINHQNDAGRTAFQLATLNGHHHLVEVLQRNPTLNTKLRTTGTGNNKQNLQSLATLEDAGIEFMLFPGNRFLNRLFLNFSRSDPSIATSMLPSEMIDDGTQSDDSDEGEMAAHTATREDNADVVGSMLKDDRLSTHDTNAEGDTLIKYARRRVKEKTSNSARIYDGYRAKQVRDGSESSTGDSSSDSERDTPDLETSSDNSLTSSKKNTAVRSKLSKQQKIDILNQQLRNNQTLDQKLAEEFVVAHYRGVNLNRNDFTAEARRQYLARNLTRHNVYCGMTYANLGTHYTQLLTAKEVEEHDQMTQKLKRLWSQFLCRKQPIVKWWDDSKRLFHRLRYAIQQRYTGCASKNYGNGQYESTWDEIWTHIGPELKKIDVRRKSDKQLLNTVQLRGNLFISAGKTTEHAVRYACGWSHASHNKGGRSDPRYRSDGKPKYACVGIVYTFMHTLSQYLAVQTSDVCQQHRSRKIDIMYTYQNETEVSFIGGIESKYIAAADRLVFPDFEREFDEEYHFQRFGLKRELYDDYKQRFSQTQRPQRDLIKILKSDYHNSYQTRYRIDQTTFDKLKRLYQRLSDDSKPLTKEELLPFGEYLSGMVVEILTSSATPHKALLWKFTTYLETYLINIGRGEYDPAYEQTYGLCRTKFEALKAALLLIDQESSDKKKITAQEFEQVAPIFSLEKSKKYRKELSKHKFISNDYDFEQAVQDAFRGQHPYRRLKNELRHHFAGGLHPYKNTSANGFFAERLFQNAKKIAQERGKTLVYIGADGRLNLIKRTSRAVKCHITKQAKDRLTSECMSDSEEPNQISSVDVPEVMQKRRRLLKGNHSEKEPEERSASAQQTMTISSNSTRKRPCTPTEDNSLANQCQSNAQPIKDQETLPTTTNLTSQPQHKKKAGVQNTLIHHGSHYRIFPTVGDGACALHALLGDSFNGAPFFYRGSKQAFIQKLNARMREPLIRSAWEQWMLAFLKDYLKYAKAPTSFSARSIELERVFESLKTQINLLKLQLNTLDQNRRNLKAGQERIFAEIIQLEMNEDAFLTIIGSDKNGNAISIEALRNDPKLRVNKMRESLDEIIQLFSESQPELSQRLNNLQQQLTACDTADHTHYLGFIRSEAVRTSYLSAIARPEYYFSIQELDIAALLFDRRVAIYNSVGRANEQMDGNQPEVVVYHEGFHFFRCAL